MGKTPVFSLRTKASMEAAKTYAEAFDITPKQVVDVFNYVDKIVDTKRTIGEIIDKINSDHKRDLTGDALEYHFGMYCVGLMACMRTIHYDKNTLLIRNVNLR